MNTKIIQGYQPITDDLDPNNPPQGGSAFVEKENIINIHIHTDWDLIDDISKIRGRNNKNWMAILKLAFQYAPKEAKILMKQIVENDAEITKITKKLSED